MSDDLQFTRIDPDYLPYIAANIICPRCMSTAVSTGHLTITSSEGHAEAAPDFRRHKAYRCVGCGMQTYHSDPERPWSWPHQGAKEKP